MRSEQTVRKHYCTHAHTWVDWIIDKRDYWWDRLLEFRLHPFLLNMFDLVFRMIGSSLLLRWHFFRRSNTAETSWLLLLLLTTLIEYWFRRLRRALDRTKILLESTKRSRDFSFRRMGNILLRWIHDGLIGWWHLAWHIGMIAIRRLRRARLCVIAEEQNPDDQFASSQPISPTLWYHRLNCLFEIWTLRELYRHCTVQSVNCTEHDKQLCQHYAAELLEVLRDSLAVAKVHVLNRHETNRFLRQSFTSLT